LRRTLPEHRRDLGALDAEAIERAIRESRPEPRDADELHDALFGLVATRIEDHWRPWLDELVRAGRAAMVSTCVGRLAFAAEKVRVVEALYPGAGIAPKVTLPAALDSVSQGKDHAVKAIVRGHCEVIGPFTPSSLAATMGLDVTEVTSATLELESEGAVLRGRFTPGSPHEEICDRRLLARIHRYTLDRLRSEIEPVSAQDFIRYLFERHHLTARSRIYGRAGLRDAIGMLQGFEIAAAAWEPQILSARVVGYRSEWLDELCFAGEIAWTRLSPGRSTTEADASASRATPITLALRSNLGWLLAAVRGAVDPEPPTSATGTAALDALRRRGALFLDDLAADAMVGRDELAAAGEGWRNRAPASLRSAQSDGHQRTPTAYPGAP
jgi:ATP-dependent helicase Lhr and Lhr-like helicase